MDLAVVVPPWIPQDDFLLKNAVEAGASLESLAKGAVRFSRRYSVTELRDRWRSLLYDPAVSAEASDSMMNLELARSCGIGVKEGSGEGGRGKRKSQSVAQSLRRQYYGMRKRLCMQVFDSLDMAMQDEMCIEKNSAVSLVQGNLDKDVSNLLVNNLVDYGNYSRLEEVGPSHSMRDVPSVPTVPVQVSLENKNRGSEARVMLPHGLQGNCASGALKVDSLLNLTNDDGILFMDIDGKDAKAMDKFCYDNVDSLLLSSPCHIQELDTETKLAMPSRSSATGLEVVSNPLGNGHGDLHFISDPGNNVPSSAAAQIPHREHSEKIMICVLNTEDPDIPCNDRTNLPVLVSHSVSPKSQLNVKEAGYSDSLINNQIKNEPDGSSKKEDFPSHSFAASQTVRPGLVPNIKASYPPVGVVLENENSGRNSISAVSRQSNNAIVNINPSHSRLVHATMTPTFDGRITQEEIDASSLAEVYAHTKAEEQKALPKSDAKSLSLDQEGGDHDDNYDNDDNGNEIPYFSDAETMILEMDLCPTDQDTNASREAFRHQPAETKRTIMRLEQCIQSSRQRTIASQGALAVLYGRNREQYIKKREVILGRATDDVQVDIDLGKEGLANKISRRQALIKLEANGSFIIKNLGKSSIFLNGKEVAMGQLRGLGASNLIEIRGISFVFEVNKKCVRRFLENVNEKERKIKRRL